MRSASNCLGEIPSTPGDQGGRRSPERCAVAEGHVLRQQVLSIRWGSKCGNAVSARKACAGMGQHAISMVTSLCCQSATRVPTILPSRRASAGAIPCVHASSLLGCRGHPSLSTQQ